MKKLKIPSIKTSLTSKISLIAAVAMILAMAAGLVATSVIHSSLINSYNRNRIALAVDKKSKDVDDSLLSIENVVKEIQLLASSSMHKEDLINHAQSIKDDGTIDKIKTVFEITAKNTKYVSSYWLALNPDYSYYDGSHNKLNPLEEDGRAVGDGFFYVKNTGELDFHHAYSIEITQYLEHDPNGNIAWWNTIKGSQSGQEWMNPYYDHNFNQNMFTYSCAITHGTDFLGAVGIDVDYNLVIDEIKKPTGFNSGNCFLLANDGTFLYHPDFVTASKNKPYSPIDTKITDIVGNVDYAQSTFGYNYKNQQRTVSSVTLRNGMVYCLSVLNSELSQATVYFLVVPIIIYAISTILMSIALYLFIRRTLKSIKNLSEAVSKVENGDLNVQVEQKTEDEIGQLSQSFNKMISAIKTERSAISALAYQDGLTGVKNKNAQEEKIMEINAKIKAGEARFAVVMLDVNDLKHINDTYGHIRGDQVIRGACIALCHKFSHSPVYRIGGDEFIAIVENEDYDNREKLFKRLVDENSTDESGKFHFSIGMATYQTGIDGTFASVYARADESMYKMKKHEKNIQ